MPRGAEEKKKKKRKKKKTQVEHLDDRHPPVLSPTHLPAADCAIWTVCCSALSSSAFAMARLLRPVNGLASLVGLSLGLLAILLLASPSSATPSPLTGEPMHFLASPPPAGNGSSAAKYLQPPSRDPWFEPPAGWQDAKPGDVLRLRAHAYPTLNIRKLADTFQMLYRTTDTNSNASWGTATVFIPDTHRTCSASNADACSHAVVGYAVPSDSVDTDATPSYLLQMREPYGEMRDMLARGWFVLVPDYEGPRASFCAGVQAGHAMLDAGRAIRQVGGQFGLRMDRLKLGFWGYSGGALATEFAVELAAAYAPELAIDAAAIGGASPNLTAADERMNHRDTAGLVVTSILGITVQQPAARAFLLASLRPTGPFNATRFLNATTMTGADALDNYHGHDILDYFVHGWADWANPALQDVFVADGAMGRHGVPRMPVFYYKAVQDEMSPVEETEGLVRSFCDSGANILFHRNSVGGHNDELWSGRPRALEFLAAKLDGHGDIAIPATGCATLNVTVPLDVLELLPDWWWTEGPGAGPSATATSANSTSLPKAG